MPRKYSKRRRSSRRTRSRRSYRKSPRHRRTRSRRRSSRRTRSRSRGGAKFHEYRSCPTKKVTVGRGENKRTINKDSIFNPLTGKCIAVDSPAADMLMLSARRAAQLIDYFEKNPSELDKVEKAINIRKEERKAKDKLRIRKTKAGEDCYFVYATFEDSKGVTRHGCIDKYGKLAKDKVTSQGYRITITDESCPGMERKGRRNTCIQNQDTANFLAYKRGKEARNVERDRLRRAMTPEERARTRKTPTRKTPTRKTKKPQVYTKGIKKYAASKNMFIPPEKATLKTFKTRKNNIDNLRFRKDKDSNWLRDVQNTVARYEGWSLTETNNKIKNKQLANAYLNERSRYLTNKMRESRKSKSLKSTSPSVEDLQREVDMLEKSIKEAEKGPLQFVPRSVTMKSRI